MNFAALKIAAGAARSSGLWLPLAIGVIARLAWAAAIPVVPLSDSLAYDTFARNLVAGYGFGWAPGEPTGFFSPGASFIYAAVYALLGVSYWPIVLLHILVSALTIALVWSLTGQWFGPRAATVAAWILALWPSQIMFVTVLATELLFNALCTSVVWIWLREKHSIWLRGALIGPVLALCALVRPHALLLPFLLALERVVRKRQWAVTIGSAALAGLLMLVIIQPWAARNHEVFGKHFLISANFGVTLWMGNNPANSGGYTQVPEDVKALNDAQRDEELKRRAMEYIMANPALFAGNTLVRLIKTHGYETIQVHWNIEGIKRVLGESASLPLRWIGTIYWYAVLLAAIGGLALLFHRDGIASVFHPTFVLWGYFASVHAMIIYQDRYHFISIPLIASLAAFAVATALKPHVKHPWRQAATLAPKYL